MHQRGSEQLDKILALADSGHDGEATAALRKARQILTRDGLSFGDLARAAARGQGRAAGMFSFRGGHREALEAEIGHLRRRLDEAQAQMQTQELQLEFWRRRACDLEQGNAQARGEIERWKNRVRAAAEQSGDTDENAAPGK